MSTTPGDPDRGDEDHPDQGAGTTPQPPAPGPPGQPPGYWQQQAAGQQPPPGYGYAPQYPVYRLADHPKATTALVLGLVGILGGLTCYLPLLLGPWAWAIGRRAVKEIDADPQRFGGRSQAMTGYVLGVVCTVLLVLGLLAFVAFLVFAFTFGLDSGEVGGISV
ncbi:MAG TPA: hypothetical protein VFH10_13415 [Nocardioides sp.]|uniref:hypothetical protein n=1 Tax=Nocardioides sp. TaxID=35761 RepID=UPI002D80D4C1|nr:hypothetical protein [Nocardioides sp.]HET6653637.1 hypothetical protein [Nocardioides sp.]